MSRPIDIVGSDQFIEMQARVRTKYPPNPCKEWSREDSWLSIIRIGLDNISSALERDEMCCQGHAMAEFAMYYFLCGWEAALIKIEGWNPD